ncbi:MAG: sugar phosphate isomerase/epimerase [Armatimonadetes bacterium]|nr:sugar phosphate isomerase/epimerase [Armatimonadota bacterium]
MEIVCPAWYPGAETLIEAIPILADQGVTSVEICTDYPRFGIYCPDYFDHRNAYEVESLMAELCASGIRVNSIHAPFGRKYDISSQCDEVHECGVDALIESIELANVTGAKIVVVHASDVVSDGVCKRMDRARGVLREMAVVAEETGVTIAVENLPPGYLGHTPEEIFKLIDGIKPGSVGVCFDSGHANMSGQFDEYARALLPHAIFIHLHDNDGNHDQHQFPGEGTIDWPLFAKLYNRLDCKARALLECAPPTDIVWNAAFQRFRKALGD